jgi:hypothetical protein
MLDWNMTRLFSCIFQACAAHKRPSFPTLVVQVVALLLGRCGAMDCHEHLPGELEAGQQPEAGCLGGP